MKGILTIIITLTFGLLIGWNLKSFYTSSENVQYQDRLQKQLDNQIEDSLTNKKNEPLLKILIENSPTETYFEEDFEFNQQSLDYLGQIGNYKVVKYQSEFGPGSKGNYKVIFYNSDNSFYGFYQPLADLGQVYPMNNDSMWIDNIGLDLKNKLPDSLQFGPDLWITLYKN